MALDDDHRYPWRILGIVTDQRRTSLTEVSVDPGLTHRHPGRQLGTGRAAVTLVAAVGDRNRRANLKTRYLHFLGRAEEVREVDAFQRSGNRRRHKGMVIFKKRLCFA